MKIEDCEFVKEFDLGGFKGSSWSFPQWLQILKMQIDSISSRIANVMVGYPDTLSLNEKTMSILMLSNSKFDNDSQFGKYNIEINTECEDNLIFITCTKYKQITEIPLVYKSDNSLYGEFKLVPISSFTDEEIKAFEKRLRGCIKLKNNFIYN